MVSRESKALLSNIIRHTDAHNKIVEEAAMWRQREATLSVPTKSCDQPRSSHKRKHRSSGPDHASPGMLPKRRRSENERNNRTAELQQFEEPPADRWGHGGYKELYPEEFQAAASNLSRSSFIEAEQKDASTLDTNEDSSCSCRKRKDKKKKKKHKKDKKDRRHVNDGAPDLCATSDSSSCRLRSFEQNHKNCCLERTCSGTESSAESPAAAALRTLSSPECNECRHGSSEDRRGHNKGKPKKSLKAKKVKVHKRKKKSKCKTR